jgi:hypothetical protein
VDAQPIAVAPDGASIGWQVTAAGLASVTGRVHVEVAAQQALVVFVADKVQRHGWDGLRAIDSDLVRDSISLSTVHFVGFACHTFVLSALRLRVHDGSGNGMRSMRHWSPIDSMAAVICRRRGRRSNTPHFSRFSGNQRTRDAGRALGHCLQPMITGGAARAAPPVISRSSRTRSPPAAG